MNKYLQDFLFIIRMLNSCSLEKGKPNNQPNQQELSISDVEI